MNVLQNVVGVYIRNNHTLVTFSALRMLYLMCQSLSVFPKVVDDTSGRHLHFHFYLHNWSAGMKWLFFYTVARSRERRFSYMQ